jgi:hypothetical protein
VVGGVRRAPLALRAGTRGTRSSRSRRRRGLIRLVGTVRAVHQQRTVALFLLAYFLYIDGVDTIIRMAVDYGMAIGLDFNMAAPGPAKRSPLRDYGQLPALPQPEEH